MLAKTTDWARLGARWLISFTIAYAFLVVLMTATAQQRVAAELDKRTPPLSYSSAFAKVKAIEEDTERLAKLRAALGVLEAKAQTSQERLAEGLAVRDNAWTSFAPLERRVARNAGNADCNLPTEPPVDPALRTAAWNTVMDCAESGSLSTTLRDQVRRARETADFATLKLAADGLKRQHDVTEGQVAKAVGDVKRAEEGVAAAESLQSTFDELDVLRGAWYTLGNALVDFPPSLLQIILAFISGTFGALLVTLILVVYPNSALAGAAGVEYGSRLLLGGLISVVVYVILGGGSAVLGNTDPFGQSQANYMTFCAVGVLAGMFSDRVAAWLSERANTFFAKGGPGHPGQAVADAGATTSSPPASTEGEAVRVAAQ